MALWDGDAICLRIDRRLAISHLKRSILWGELDVEAALRDRIIQRLLSVSDAKLAPSDIKNTTLRNDLDIGSLELVGLATDLEEELGIDIDNAVLGHIRTMGDLFGAIENAQRPSGPA
jgi:acyl carrier protein